MINLPDLSEYLDAFSTYLSGDDMYYNTRIIDENYSYHLFVDPSNIKLYCYNKKTCSTHWYLGSSEFMGGNSLVRYNKSWLIIAGSMSNEVSFATVNVSKNLSTEEYFQLSTMIDSTELYCYDYLIKHKQFDINYSLNVEMNSTDIDFDIFGRLVYEFTEYMRRKT